MRMSQEIRTCTLLRLGHSYSAMIIFHLNILHYEKYNNFETKRVSFVHLY